MNHLETGGQYDCTPYIEDGFYLHELLFQLTSSCSCTKSAGSVVTCEELNTGLPYLKPIFWMQTITCKPSISADCKAIVKELYKVWIKVPSKGDDEMCEDAYEKTKTLADSSGCN